jgi:hypothetical protein
MRSSRCGISLWTMRGGATRDVSEKPRPSLDGDEDALAPLGRELDDDGVALGVQAGCAREASPVSAHV